MSQPAPFIHSSCLQQTVMPKSREALSCIISTISPLSSSPGFDGAVSFFLVSGANEQTFYDTTHRDNDNRCVLASPRPAAS
ncbi:unnamed protein product [Chondrus crispus]|uniref:Uncharacterized protein n=1 Tax=Chondrus crispus TaxID=2769 RepID=R7Q8K6_CHOCR|nr:unnamed protein product [Chondrus crispus]CDF34364.1 unnamed protein product [Chondrus crispus]|eukprot:XP_005714183.1 unnamed protein product [Chondrus crispus]